MSGDVPPRRHSRNRVTPDGTARLRSVPAAVAELSYRSSAQALVQQRPRRMSCGVGPEHRWPRTLLRRRFLGRLRSKAGGWTVRPDWLWSALRCRWVQRCSSCCHAPACVSPSADRCCRKRCTSTATMPRRSTAGPPTGLKSSGRPIRPPSTASILVYRRGRRTRCRTGPVGREPRRYRVAMADHPSPPPLPPPAPPGLGHPETRGGNTGR